MSAGRPRDPFHGNRSREIPCLGQWRPYMSGHVPSPTDAAFQRAAHHHCTGRGN